jgi:hypothetical protein
MARSLTIKHEEQVTTSPLLTVFLLLAFGWLVVTAIAASTADAGTAPAPDAATPEQR